jgi:hypothetical protein
MLLIIFLGLIAKLTSVSGYRDVRTLKLNDIDWNRLVDIVFTRFL